MSNEFNEKCTTCQCYNCTFDYGRAVCASSCLCKHAVNFPCYSCRQYGDNRDYCNVETPQCTEFIKEDDYE